MSAAEPGTNWWSFQPLQKPKLPRLEGDQSRNPIDRFLGAKLARRGLRFSPEASRPTLIRRLKFDLLGLPPSPEEILSFQTDTDPQAYEKLVDRYLASPAFGERWARHWLDVVHFGETHGYDKDKLRPNAWPYRDYVIRAFNQDKPYGRFVREQVAGDALYPETRDGIEALGFIAAGPWDFIGHEEVPETKIDGKIARHLDRDDMLVNTIQTFTSLTVQCAQCHNHKFDPISQEDYYSLHAVFAAVDRTDRRYELLPETGLRRVAAIAAKAAKEKELNDLNSVLEDRGGSVYADLKKQIRILETPVSSAESVGSHSQIEPKPDVEKWFQVDLGKPTSFDQVILHPAHDKYNNIGDGFGFPVRLRIDASDDPEFKLGTVRLDADSKADLPNPKLTPFVTPSQSISKRYVRVTATTLAPRQGDFIFALAELEVMSSANTNLALNVPVTGKDTIEAPPRWRLINLTDGIYPGKKGIPTVRGEGLASFQSRAKTMLLAIATAEEKARLNSLKNDLDQLTVQISNLPPQGVVYAAGIHTGNGSFTGTGAKGGSPRPIHLLKRGSIDKPGKELGPGTLTLVKALPARFETTASQNESDRRAALAQWLSSPENPLTWRSIVNRIWQEHFGRGLVETPNDFGHMGASPTHPELLDWLAVEFRDGGQSLRSLHRLLVTSAAYRQTSSNNPKSSRVDGDNSLLWRMNRRKLQAEAVRDTVLTVAGRLDSRMGGASFQDFVIDKPEHSPHYEYGWFDPENPVSQRRSIYRFIVRSQPQPFMAVLDCADPSMQVAKRNESVSPLQALAMMNNSLMIVMSRYFAQRLEGEDSDLHSQLSNGLFLALGRPATISELETLSKLAREHGLPNAARVIFNLNEFSFVD